MLSEQQAPPLPDGAREQVRMFRAELEREERIAFDLRPFAQFFLWAEPYFNAKHIGFFGRAIELDLTLSKLFMAGIDKDKKPLLLTYEAEMDWISALPFKYAGIHFGYRKIVFYVEPEEPFKFCYIILNIDIEEKIAIFKDKDILTIQEVDILGKIGRRRDIELIEIDSGFFKKRKSNKRFK